MGFFLGGEQIGKGGSVLLLELPPPQNGAPGVRNSHSKKEFRDSPPLLCWKLLPTMEYPPQNYWERGLLAPYWGWGGWFWGPPIAGEGSDHPFTDSL